MIEREPQERERLPTREQIEAITDMAALRNLEEAIIERAARIETDLEFRSDGDLDWERRARGALTAHRATLTVLRKHIHRRIKGVGPPAQADVDHKKDRTAQNRATQAQEALAAAERKRFQAEAVRSQELRLNRKMVERLSFLHHFFTAAHTVLSEEDCRKISTLASDAARVAAGEILGTA